MNALNQGKLQNNQRNKVTPNNSSSTHAVSLPYGR